jgi:hypothetical protein
MDIREDLWPVLYVRISGAVTDRGWRDMYAAYARFYAKKQRYLCITDATGLRAVPDAQARGLIASLAKVHEPDSKLWIWHSHVVFDSAIVRGALTAITWLAPPVYPISYVATAKDAVARSVSILQEARMQVPESLRVFGTSLV